MGVNSYVLEDQQLAFIGHVMTSKTLSQAAKKANIHLHTAQRWLTEPAVIKELVAARRAVIDWGIKELQRRFMECVDTLFELNGEAETDAVRLAAAKTLMEYAFKGTEMADLSGRIERLEAAGSAAGWNLHDNTRRIEQSEADGNPNGHAAGTEGPKGNPD